MTTQSSGLASIPVEIFIKLCKFLPPIDLCTLGRVCSRFRDFLEGESSSTQLIWRDSRIAFLPPFRLGPHPGMTERDYVKLIMGKKCQICSVTGISEGVLVRSEFGMRLCHQCCTNKSKSEHLFRKSLAIDPFIFKIVPYRVSRKGVKSYWIPHVYKLNNEYKYLSDDEKAQFRERKLREVAQLLSELSERQEESRIVIKENQKAARANKEKRPSYHYDYDSNSEDESNYNYFYKSNYNKGLDYYYDDNYNYEDGYEYLD